MAVFRVQPLAVTLAEAIQFNGRNQRETQNLANLLLVVAILGFSKFSNFSMVDEKTRNPALTYSNLICLHQAVGRMSSGVESCRSSNLLGVFAAGFWCLPRV
jgi:hypothetical protein